MNGLYLDPEGELLAAADRMFKWEEKAIPLAGAAVRITPLPASLQGSTQSSGASHAGEPAESQPPASPPADTGKSTARVAVHSPLGETTSPVHLNGFFDLDSSRHALTTESGQTGKDHVRVEWNEVLVRHAVSRAYAALVEKAVGDIGEQNALVYYALWPDGSQQADKPFQELAKHVFKHLESRHVIRTASETRWVPISAVFLLTSEWKGLRKPLIREKLPMTDPSLPAHITNGFELAGIKTQTLLPQYT